MGLQERLRLEKDNLSVDIAPELNGEVVWSEVVQAYVDDITEETEFDALIAPYLNDRLARCDMVFIKSSWLAQYVVPKSTTFLKPDAFATHVGMYHAKPPPNNDVQRGNGVRCGVAEEELYDCVILFERKLTITDEALGK